jgi:uncharacterized alpha-E superfamily protein
MLSRVADNLYWMSRYLERAEHTCRLIAVKLDSIIDESKEDAEISWRRLALALSADHGNLATFDAFAATQALAFERLNPSSLLSSLRHARDNARQVREQISTEMWNHLNQLYLRLAPANVRAIWNEQPSLTFRDTIAELLMFEGVAFSTMRHGEGWHFIQLGRYIERAQLVSRLLDLHVGAAAASLPRSSFADWIVLLKSCTAFEAYCKVYTADIRPERIAEFLLFDAEFPHSVRFAVDRMRDALAEVAPGAPPPRRAACERLVGKLKASVDFGQIEEIIGGGSIAGFLAGITSQCEQIHEAVHEAYIAYGAETVV